VRELRDREDVDQIEEQLERRGALFLTIARTQMGRAVRRDGSIGSVRIRDRGWR
jgi:hypothetical protein